MSEVDTTHWKLCRAIYDQMGLHYIEDSSGDKSRFDKAVQDGEKVSWLIGTVFEYLGNMCVRVELEGKKENLEHVMKMVTSES